ncbi:hypothetical protein PI126_g3834 [Phytophthora idaei]|nr:hypothetical protein PI126_g3834 [Phytophthora idaei]
MASTVLFATTKWSKYSATSLKTPQLCSPRSLVETRSNTTRDMHRTALYVASSFGRHKIVTLLLDRGADKDLQCDGVRPIDVAGFASAGSIDRMKVRALLQGDSCPQVILRLDDKHLAGETRRFRLQIHFSEPVDEFTQEDVTVSEGCEVTQFSMLRRDLYHATVQLAQESSEASVEVLAGAARAAVGGRCNAQSRPLQLLA